MDLLLVMAKKPEVGATKTRLTPPLSATQAADLYAALLQDTIALAASIRQVRLGLAISPPEALDFFFSLAPEETLLLPVAGENIGVCLRQVLELGLRLGYKRVCALNSDGPSLPAAFLHQAFQLLAEHDVVLGPNQDGGYYLVGLKQPLPELFQGIAWSTEQVMPQSLGVLARLEKQVALLPPWYDVDDEQSLRRLAQEIDDLPQLRHTRKFLAQHTDWERGG